MTTFLKKTNLPTILMNLGFDFVKLGSFLYFYDLNTFNL